MRDQQPGFPARRVIGAGLLSALLALVASWSALASADEIDDLRGDIPAGDDLRDELDTIAGQLDELLAARNGAESDLNTILEARNGLDEEQQRLVVEIEAATGKLRDIAVRSFVTGGPISRLGYLLGVSDASDLAWRQHLIRNHAGAADVAIEELRQLEDAASDDVKQSLVDAARLRADITRLESELAAMAPREAEVSALLPLAEAWDRAVIAIEEGSFGIAPKEKWEALRFCESTSDYTAISSSGAYRGAYQFDIETWETVGGHGDPAAALPAEQDARARELYARRGHEPWPKCGEYLE